MWHFYITHWVGYELMFLLACSPNNFKVGFSISCSFYYYSIFYEKSRGYHFFERDLACHHSAFLNVP